MTVKALFPTATTAAAVLSLVGGVTGSRAAWADVSLPHLLSEGCVLQQQAPVRIWGKADPGEAVTVLLQGKTVQTTAGPDGKFAAMLKDLKAGGPFTLTVKGAKNTVEIKDVLVGEVWVCSGQSNMEFPLAGSMEGPADIAASADPQLRMFTVTKQVSNTPQEDVAGGTWQSAAPNRSGGFSAVGYYFARALRQARKVPIGMIHTSWGGTRIETWISKASLKTAQTPPGEFDWLTKPSDAVKQGQERYEKQLAAFKAAGSPQTPYLDPGIAASTKDWATPDLASAADWSTVNVPGEWDTLGKSDLAAIDGGVWFRKEIDLPADAAGKEASLTLGAIDDTDQTYVNGTKVGATGPETPSSWSTPRKYTVPAGVLKAGKNVIAVRVWDAQGGGGFTGPAGDMQLTPTGGAPLALAGEWHYKVEASHPQPPAAAGGLDPQAATGLYNGMLAPLTPYAIRGAIWYQGESNAGAPMRYRTLMPAMIQDWRRAWGEPVFPFFMVQLAPFSAGNAQGTNWAELRESQVETARNLPNAGTAVITDVGDLDDIHPRNKRPVGERLALLARRIAYGEKLVYQGPTIHDFDRNVDSITITFDNVGAGLEARGQMGQLVGWEIAGGDGKYYPAQAVIQGKNRVVVASPEVSVPFHVRYGWANFPTVNLYNKEGLPASPFRTDVPLIPVEGR